METHPKRSTVYIPVNIQSIHIWGAQGQKGALKESSCLQGLGKTEVQNKTIHFESSHTADAPLQKRPKKTPHPLQKQIGVDSVWLTSDIFQPHRLG